MKDKSMIHQFDPVIYPCRIWIGINPSFNDVKDNFWALTDNMQKMEFTDKDYSPNRFIIATNYPVVSKNEGWIGIFISIFKKNMLEVKTITHESSHAADFFCEQFGISNGSFEHGEARAYLQGWIADCINQVKTGKLKV